jgi:hypoxanthine phosphoribosyltransferase
VKKEFIKFDLVRDNAIKLAHRIYNDGFIPDVIYVSLRGGAYLGNIISEYYKIVLSQRSFQLKAAHPVYYAAVVARSYTDVAHAEKVKVDGWTYSPDFLRVGDKILLIDDIFDSGRTINHLAQVIMDKGVPRKDLKIAVHDYKYFFDKGEQLPVQPDYWCRKHEMSIHDESSWIHYMSHELVGLTEVELEESYYKHDPSLREAMSLLVSSEY